MDRVNQFLPGGGGVIGQLVFTILALVALYYLYQWLFGPGGLEGKTVLNGIYSGAAETPYVILKNDFPTIQSGGEYTINLWVYVTDYSYRQGNNKHILTLGGDSKATLLVFLGRYKNSLSVRVDSNNSGPTGTSSIAAARPSPDSTDSLTKEAVDQLLTSIVPDSDALNPTRPCDIGDFNLQKWVQVTVALNNKTVDVYIDGKLARSCINNGYYSVDDNNLRLTLADKKGFAGYISNVSAYNYALNPEQVWRLYMTGPGPQYSIWEYVKSLFDPSTSLGNFDYPKLNYPNNPNVAGR
jgi:hypothetical protein